MGIALGLSAALWFAVSTLLLRVGMRTSPRDDGLWMTIAVNVLVLGTVGLFISKPDWSTAGIATLAAAGVIGGVGGRYSNLRAIRYLGATRATVFTTGTPLVAAVSGWIILDEKLGPVDAIGGALVILGLYVLINSRSAAVAVAGGSQDKRSLIVGKLYAATAPTLFGLAFVVRKWGLRSFDSAVLGALIGAVSGLLLLTLIDIGRNRLGTRLRDNLKEINWWFVASGGGITLALLSQFSAFSFVAAWVVGVLQGTQVLWVLVLSRLFLHTEERIDRTVMVSVFLVASGVTLIAVSL